MDSLNINNLFSVKGMVFVVTGGGSGLGASMAKGLAANGASKVFILGRREKSLEATVAAAPGIIIPIVADTSSKESLTAAVEKIKEQAPFINTLIANAGIGGPVTAMGSRPSTTTLSELQADLWKITEADNSSIFDINVLGTWYTYLAFVDLLDAGNKHPNSIGSKGYIQSQLITTSSFVGFVRTENMSHMYAASKAAMVHMTKMISTAFSSYGIRANSIAPGLFITEATDFVANGADLSIPGSIPKESIPAMRSGSPEDIAGAALFLSSRAGGFINGEILVIDGGAMGLIPSSY